MCVCVCVCVLATESCTVLCDSMKCSLLASSVHVILQAKTVQWVAIPYSRGPLQPRDGTLVSCTAGRFFNVRATIFFFF